ncbi:MAG: DUF1566 domain-containing protein [Methylovulum sp.]|nr:DUF1566 domain-containing protein [Methylovulum sp.]
MSIHKKIIYACCLLMAFNSTVALAQTCQTATIPATTPSSRFTVPGNGTVTDTKTGLMWKQCSEGLSGADCSVGGAGAYTWQGALQQAQTVNANGGFAGYSDWRVPNVKELRSITERQCYDPTINVAVFPHTVSSLYWSSSPVANYSGYAWNVSFGYGHDHWYDKNFSYYVRLVRSGQ